MALCPLMTQPGSMAAASGRPRVVGWRLFIGTRLRPLGLYLCDRVSSDMEQVWLAEHGCRLKIGDMNVLGHFAMPDS